MMRTLLLSLSLGLLALPGHAETPADYATGITLTIPGKEAFYRVELPLAVHAQARPDLADVRVFNAQGETVPYALGAWREADSAEKPATLHDVARFPLKAAGGAGLAGLELKIEQNTNGKVIALSSVRGSTTTASTKIIAYVFDASALTQDTQALLLDWPASANGYSAQATLEASDDLKSWHYLAAAPLLEMNFGGQQLAQKRIAFTRGKYKYLRLSADQALPVFSLTQVEAAPNAGPTPSPRRWLEISARAGEKTGEYLFDSGAHLTVSALDLQLPQGNTVAPVELLVRERGDLPWRPVTHSISYRLTRDGDRKGQDISSPMLNITPQAGRFWLLRVDPRAGGLGRGMPVLKLGWSPRQLVFVTRGEGPFTLAFGRRDARPAQLPLASLLPGYIAGAETALPSATAGASRALGGKAAGPEDAGIAWKKWILWGVLILGIALLAWMARGLMQEMPPKS